jgi:hypothetical protein
MSVFIFYDEKLYSDDGMFATVPQSKFELYYRFICISTRVGRITDSASFMNSPASAK